MNGWDLLREVPAHVGDRDVDLPSTLQCSESEMRMPLEGRTALITGASRGIGQATATAMVRAGARVAVLARSSEALAELVIDLGGPEVAFAVPCDVTDADQVGDAVGAAIETLGVLDIVVNNAGGCRFTAPFEAMRPSGWQSTTRLNLDSVMHVSQAVAGHLVERGRGSVINVASTVAIASMRDMTHYVAAKAAVIGFTRSLALEWAAHGIRVNCISPGWTETDMTSVEMRDPEKRNRIASQVPLGRWASPQEMAAPAVFLASDAASYITGQNLIIDGGLTL
jgi:NAD(P)-dependent dehydrogenase (short-subunit alcohol dehydrogenase family)